MYENKRHSPKIIATTMEQFQKIAELLKELPDAIIEQIEKAEFGAIGLTCTFSTQYSNDRTIFFNIPKTTRQISDFGDYVGIYTDDKFFFKIDGENYKRQPLSYLFHDLIIEKK